MCLWFGTNKERIHKLVTQNTTQPDYYVPMLGITPAQKAVTNFQQQLAVFKGTECDVSTTTDQLCTFNTIDVSRCKGLTLNCCNKSETDILDCTSSWIMAAATSASSHTAKATGTSPEIEKRLLNYIENNNLAPPPGSTRPGEVSNISQLTQVYLNNVCASFDAVSQTAVVPTLKAFDCQSDTVDIYNQSDVNIRCAMGALSQLFPNTSSGAPSPSPWTLAPSTVPYLVAIGASGAAFLAIGIAAWAMAPSD